jgi:hypothetical protein
MVQQLNQQSIGITEVKRACTIAMRPGRLGKWNVQFLNAAGPLVDILDMPHDEADMVNLLYHSGLNAIGQLVNGEIVASRREVDVIFVGLPFHPHPENVAVKVNGSRDIADI